MAPAAITPATGVVATGDVVVILTPAAVEPALVFEAILTAQPDTTTETSNIEVRNPRTGVRLARRNALG